MLTGWLHAVLLIGFSNRSYAEKVDAAPGKRMPAGVAAVSQVSDSGPYSSRTSTSNGTTAFLKKTDILINAEVWVQPIAAEVGSRGPGQVRKFVPKSRNGGVLISDDTAKMQ